MKLVLNPKNFTVSLRDSADRLVGSDIITDQSPLTFLFKEKGTSGIFKSISMTFNTTTMSITVDGKNTYEKDAIIYLGEDEKMDSFVFVDSKDIEPCVAQTKR